MQLAFTHAFDPSTAAKLSDPESYRGIYAFHKYWGKKPAEPVRYLIEHLCPESGLVVDPFMGSGVAAVESIRLKRRFVGLDINPAAVRIARLLVAPPDVGAFQKAFNDISRRVRDEILQSYMTVQKKPATHYVWRNEVIEMVWLKEQGIRNHLEMYPSEHDVDLAHRFSSYQLRRLRAPRFFSNSRINSDPSLTLRDLFTGRALRNIELLLDAIEEQPAGLQEPLRLSLTAAAGQMSKMVFAITGRGKNNGGLSKRMEVGSWVIGYWRPKQHFELNVWNCFERRAQKLVKALSELEITHFPVRSDELAQVCMSEADYALLIGDALQILPEVVDDSVDLIITDPPHSDRIPYLELSEMWNVLLGEEPSFEPEIVVSNAKERSKTNQRYNEDMSRFLDIAGRKLREKGGLVLFFNARSESSWKFLDQFSSSAGDAGMTYSGCFPLVYSASSVVQDNRDGALKTDYGLVFSRSTILSRCLAEIPGWTPGRPRHLE